MTALHCGLVADIVGTNCRLGLIVRGGDAPRMAAQMAWPCARHATPDLAVRACLAAHPAWPRPRHAVLAVAGPVSLGRASLTNHRWVFDEARLSACLVGAQVRLINDVTALALCLPVLGRADCTQIGPRSRGQSGGTMALLGPGPGFGMAALHEAMAEIAGVPHCGLDAAEITTLAAAGHRPATVTVDRFCAVLGAVAGDLALALGALGGVFLAGGIAPRLLDTLTAWLFRARFEDKGRVAAYPRNIPTRLITAPDAALRGATLALATLALATLALATLALVTLAGAAMARPLERTPP